jgi:hypothetical protein
MDEVKGEGEFAIANLNPDQMAQYDELGAALAEADSAY